MSKFYIKVKFDPIVYKIIFLKTYILFYLMFLEQILYVISNVLLNLDFNYVGEVSQVLLL